MNPDPDLSDLMNSFTDEQCSVCGGILDESQDFVLAGKNDELVICLVCGQKARDN